MHRTKANRGRTQDRGPSRLNKEATWAPRPRLVISGSIIGALQGWDLLWELG